MTVDVNIFDYASVSRAQRNLEEYFADLIEKANELCRRLAEIGKVRAELDFSNAIYDGTNDVTVHVEPIDNGYVVRATGGAVMFIEFGAGVYHNGSGSYPGELPPGVVGICSPVVMFFTEHLPSRSSSSPRKMTYGIESLSA